MFYFREEGEEIRQGFNFYPRKDEGSAGCQMLFGSLRVEARWSKRRKRLRLGAWLRTHVELPKEEIVYVPGQTEELTELYEKQFSWDGKKYTDWCHDLKLEEQRAHEQAERNRIRDALRKAVQ